MRLLMLLHRFFPPDIRVEKEARSLLKAGHEVFLLSASKGDMPDEEMVEGIKVIRNRWPKFFPRRVWNFFYFQVFFIHPFWKKALEDAVKQYEIQAIHVHDLPLVRTGLNAARKFNLPLIADLHENYPEAIKVWGRSWKGKAIIVNLTSPAWRWKRLWIIFTLSPLISKLSKNMSLILLFRTLVVSVSTEEYRQRFQRCL
jgi:hypothetical protein